MDAIAQEREIKFSMRSTGPVLISMPLVNWNNAMTTGLALVRSIFMKQ
jgi:hypothetical protein